MYIYIVGIAYYCLQQYVLILEVGLLIDLRGGGGGDGGTHIYVQYMYVPQ